MAMAQKTAQIWMAQSPLLILPRIHVDAEKPQIHEKP
jgi:hypothetical protein